MRHTLWKKSRKYGNRYGGTSRSRTDQSRYIKLHNFQRPGSYEEVPIIRVDNPSRDWFHPLNADQIRYALRALPEGYHEDVSHVWLRRGGSSFPGDQQCVANAIWGGGVTLITLYPTKRSLIRDHGRQKPSAGAQRIYQKYGATLRRKGSNWQSIWTLTGLRKYYLYEALYYCVAEHSAYVWREGRSNLEKAKEQRVEDWLIKKQGLAAKVYQDLFN